MGEVLIDVFDHGKMTVPIDNRSVALGTFQLAQFLILAYSRITSERLVRSEFMNL